MDKIWVVRELIGDHVVGYYSSEDKAFREKEILDEEDEGGIYSHQVLGPYHVE